MGKGDKKSAKGKISIGSYGKSRPHKPRNKEASKPANEYSKPSA
ncbi:MAG: 30S ribosomal protein THX [Bacteroidetes bacterium]|nr:30S ribosomal protein THX [Bacteroidota bacterium]